MSGVKSNRLLFGVGLAVLAAWASTSVRAQNALSLSCKPQETQGKDPVVSILVRVDGPAWQITHVAASGARYERAEQYRLHDTSSQGVRSWEGTLTTRLNLRMIGTIDTVGSRYTYTEALFDSNKQNNKVLEIASACEPSTAAATLPVNPPLAGDAPTPIGGNPCQQITAACQRAGFVQGGAQNGNGLIVNCVRPILTGSPPAPGARALPLVAAAVAAACRNSSGGAQVAAPRIIPPQETTTFTLTNKTCLGIDHVVIDGASHDANVGPAESASFLVPFQCSHTFQALSGAMHWDGASQCNGPPFRTFSWGLTNTSGASSEELPEGSLLAETRYNGGGGELIITSKMDCIEIDAVEGNRGNCNISPANNPVVLKFGQSFTYYYTCDRLLEARVTTGSGTSTLTWDN